MEMRMFFNSWDGILRVLVVGVLAYISLVLLLRLMGKRTLSKMNAFDWIVTVAIGSMLANILLNHDVPLLEGITGIGLLVLLQFAITWLSVRVPAFASLIKAQPALLYYRGRYLEDALRRERVLEVEVKAAVRAQGQADMGSVLAVVLETDGSFTVIPQDSQGALSALDPLAHPAGLDERLEK
jgi:uncharacterized membrane protein YcaP (DUF421 family)